jgi:hypothetical protein
MAKDKNNYFSKIKRTLTAFLPISRDRIGDCGQCGRCCRLPEPCIFYDAKKKEKMCGIYFMRPLNCRKYPRTANEQIVFPCSYHFA